MVSPEEVQILKQARLVKEMIETEGWKALCEVLRAQILTRELLIRRPLHDLPHEQFPGMDLASKAAAVEAIKGAVIGLNLALSLPESIINSANEIMAESKKEKA